MRAQRNIAWLPLLLFGMSSQFCTASAMPRRASLCDLQRAAKQGERQSVEVEGIYGKGFEMGVLSDAACRSERTWVELDLSSPTNKETLRSMLETNGLVDVVFEGEFYGPGVPDPKLSETSKKPHQPGWGPLEAFRTKLVVHTILSVRAVPLDQQSAADLSHHVPILRESALPMYPPLPEAARITGKVIVRVRVKYGVVVKTDVISKLDAAGQRLEMPTVANIRTWQFDSNVDGEFTVTYTYAIAGEETETHMNPVIEMLPSLDVNITARPVKPVVMHDLSGRAVTR